MSLLRPLSRLPTRAAPALRSFYSSIPGEVPPTPGKRSPADPVPATSNANARSPTNVQPETKGYLTETLEQAQEIVKMQAPNRQTTWSRSQQPREKAMVGPRFEQTVMEAQPRPYAAIELVHKVPVIWTDKRVIACDGGMMRCTWDKSIESG